MISVSILPSNRNFPENRERAEGEEDAPARRERERERERERGRRERGRSVRRPTLNPFDFAVRFREPRSQTPCEPRSLRTPIVANPDREPRSRTQIANPSRTQIANPDRKPKSQHRFVVPDREPRSVAPQNRSSSTPKPIVLPPFFSPFDRIMIFFSWVLFVFLCDFDFCCCGGVMVVFWWLWLLIAGVCYRGLNCRVKNW